MKNFIFISFQYLIPQHALSRLIGRLAEVRIPWVKNLLIAIFIKKFNVDMSEAETSDIRAYEHFNAFFTRALKEGSRPFDKTENVLCSPADGTISQIGKIQKQQIFQAKGRFYSLATLLACPEKDAKQFEEGEFATIYLSPKDYHRVHMPVSGRLKKMTYVPGHLFSVNQTTAENVDALFAKNERLVCDFETSFGPMSMILVGAMIVAGIETTWAGVQSPRSKKVISTVVYDPESAPTFEKGDEMGRFKLGSTVILVFPKNSVTWQNELSAASALQVGRTVATVNEMPF